LHDSSPESLVFSTLVARGSVTSAADTFPIHNVMAGLVPAIHVFLLARLKDVDARHKAGHDW
jgi:hypothetical protein